MRKKQFEYKTIKCKFKKILKPNINYSKFENILHKEQELSTRVTFFIRSYLIYCFENNIKLKNIDKMFLRCAFKILMKESKLGRPISKNNEDLYKSMENFYKQYFPKLDKINGINLSFINGQVELQIYTSLKNNINICFEQYVRRFININFTPIVKTIPTIEKEKKEFYKEIKKIKIDFLENTKTCNKEHRKWIDENRNKYIPSTYNRKNFQEKEIESNMIQYLKCMYLMNKIIEEKNGKCFQFFPLRMCSSMNHFKINTSALVEIFVDDNMATKFIIDKNTKNGIKEVIAGKNDLLCKVGISKFNKFLWDTLFNINIIKYPRYIFANEIDTDLHSVSILFLKNSNIIKLKAKKKKIRDGREKSQKSKHKTNIKNNKNIDRYKIHVSYKNKTIKDLNDFVNDDMDTMETYIDENKKINKVKQKFLKFSMDNKINKIIRDELKHEFPRLEIILQDVKIRKYFNEAKINKKLLFCDPGKRSPLFIMGYNGNKSINITKKLKNYKKYKFFEYTNGMRLKSTRRIIYRRKLELQKYKIIIHGKTLFDLEKELSKFNKKTCKLKEFLKYTELKLSLNKKLKNMDYNKLCTKYKWYGFINKKRHEDKILNQIEKQFGKNIIIIYGGWKDSGKLKFISTPTSGLKKKLSERFQLVMIDEFRTSKIYHKDNQECGHLQINKGKKEEIKVIHIKTKKHIKIKKIINKGQINEDKNIKTTTKLIHAVLTFKMKNKVIGCINRDRNAVLNFERITTSLIDKGIKPPIFIREP